MYSLEQARRNASKVADGIWNLHVKPEVLDDGEYYIFQWVEETDEIPIGVLKSCGGICPYDPEGHPAFKDAVVIT